MAIPLVELDINKQQEAFSKELRTLLQVYAFRTGEYITDIDLQMNRDQTLVGARPDYSAVGVVSKSEDDVVKDLDEDGQGLDTDIRAIGIG